MLSEVLDLTRRIAAVVAVLALGAGNVAVCAGWQATAEARMACCMSSTTCPMQKSTDHDHSSQKNAVSQTQADSCCAASSQKRESSSPASTFAISGVIALVPAVFSLPTTVLRAQEWRALVPLRVSSTPKHLLLSVLIV